MKKILSLAIVALILSACVNRTADKNNIRVYINSGAIQCESDGKTVAETALLLTQQAINVSSSQCGFLSNVVVVAMCGSIATNINVHQISSADLSKAQALGFENVDTLKQQNDLGYQLSDCK